VGLNIRDEALRKLAQQDLSFEERADGSVRASFNYLATTCRNTGWDFQSVIYADLRPENGDWRIEDVNIELDADDPGWLETCIHESNVSPDPKKLTRYSSARGMLLNEFLEHDWPVENAGCFCTSIHVTHKLILALSATRYRLTHREEFADA
jgi:hypothetical protein